MRKKSIARTKLKKPKHELYSASRKTATKIEIEYFCNIFAKSSLGLKKEMGIDYIQINTKVLKSINCEKEVEFDSFKA